VHLDIQFSQQPPAQPVDYLGFRYADEANGPMKGPSRPTGPVRPPKRFVDADYAPVTAPSRLRN